MAKIILVEGPDNAGKTTFIQGLESLGMKLIRFPKKTSEGRFTCLTRNEVAIFETMLNYLDDNYVYILDRGCLSNIVYESVLRGKRTGIYMDDFKRLADNNKVLVVGLTRNKLEDDFADDLIAISEDQFNKVVDEFEKLYKALWITPYKILEHDVYNGVVEAKPFDQVIADLKIKEFIGAKND